MPRFCGNCDFFLPKEQDDDGVWHGRCNNKLSQFYKDIMHPDTTEDDRLAGGPGNDCYKGSESTGNSDG